MASKGSGPTRMLEIDRFDEGVGWIAYPDETMERASHALVTHDGVWLVDPVDAPGVDDLVADVGPVGGVVVTLDRHTRDAGVLARRHGVSVSVPRTLRGVRSDLDAPVEIFDKDLGGTGYRAITLVDLPFWREVGLFDGSTLVVGDALGTASYFRTDCERIGVHPFLRVSPPRAALGEVEPDRILVGHGTGVLDGATGALSHALRGSRRRGPRLYVKNVRRFLIR